jgi:uncharacterized GH25 family protein
MFKKTLLLAMLAGLSVNALAHRPWLLPSSSVVDAREAWVTFDAAISEGLFDLDHQPLKLDGLVIVGPDGASLSPENVLTGRLRTTFDLKLPKQGTYKVSLVNESANASFKVGGEMKRLRGTDASFAKEIPANAEEVTISRMHSRIETFVTNTTGSGSFKPSGAGLEFEPLTSPTDLRHGEPARWRFWVDGKPADKLAFSLIPGAVKYRGTLGELRFTTDAKGEITLTLPEAGMYMLTSSWPQAAGGPGAGGPGPGGPGRAQPPRRVSYTATLEVLPQ